MCLGASECLKCGRWLQPLLLTSNEVRQTAASLQSIMGLQKCSKQLNKRNWEGGNHVCRVLQGVCSYSTVCSASLLAPELTQCSQGRGVAVCHMFCST